METRRRKKDTAGEVEAATAQVAAEIASGMAVEKSYDFPPITLLDQNRQDNYIEGGGGSCGPTPSAWRIPSAASAWTPPAAT